MMGAITTTRRALRLPLRAEALIELDGTPCDGHAEDLGPYGCRLVSPVAFPAGTHLRLVLLSGGTASPLWAGATVVWQDAGPPWRHGVAFDAHDQRRTAAWFDGLVEHHCELFHLDRVPDRLWLDARVYVGRAPEELPRLCHEEAAVLQQACAHATVADLRRTLGADFARAQRALFSLLGRGALTLDPAEAGDPQAWRGLLEASPG